MAGKRTSGRPLPDGHPFKGGCIIFGSNIPEAWKERFRKKKQEPSPGQSSTHKDGQPSARREPGDLETQAFQDYEQALSNSIDEKAEAEKEK